MKINAAIHDVVNYAPADKWLRCELVLLARPNSLDMVNLCLRKHDPLKEFYL